MHLEKIEITGFKSFADKTVLRFDDPITAIVGPNGCGKSNIVDAFRWVLGEGSAKSLRSDKMVDVIFGGSSTRKPLNLAQISLTFTQINKTLSLDYEELCITRRIHRNGDSEWYVNRNPVRLKDVHKILWEAGIGKNAFYIFEQGKVDDLITSTPLERRCIFEEAAKIMHFKEKKKEALRKLKQVEENLKRVLDIQSEVDKQIETLQKQAEEARIYTKNKERLGQLEKGLVVYKWKHNQKKFNLESQTCQANSTAQQDVQAEIEALEQHLKILKDTHTSKSAETRKAYEAFFEIKKAKELASFEFNSHQKHLKELGHQKENLKSTLHALHQKHLKEHRTFEENQKHLKDHEHDVISLSNNLKKINTTLFSLEERVEKETSLRKEAQQQLMTVVNSENQLQSNYKNNTTQLHGQKEELAKILHQEKTYLKEIEEKKSAQRILLKSFETLSSDLEKDQETLINIKEKLTTDREALDSHKEELKELSSKRTENKATLDLLTNLKNSFEGYNQSSKKLLQFAKDKEHPLYEKISPLTDWFQPNSGYEAHLSTLLQPYLQTLVVKTREDLELVKQVAQKEHLQKFSCLCLEHLPSFEKDANLLEMAKLNQVSAHFLKGLHEDAEGTLNCMQEGYYLDHLGIHHRISIEDQNLFLREVELSEKEQERIQLDVGHQKIVTQVETLQKKVSALKEQHQKLQQKRHQNELDANKTQYTLKNYKEELNRLEKNVESFESKKEELSASIATLEAKQKEFIDLCKSEETKRKHQESYFSKIENQFETNFGALKEKRGLKQSLEDKIKTFEKEAQSLKESIRVFEAKSVSFEDQVKEISSVIENKEAEFSSLEQKNALFEKKEEEFLVKVKSAEQKYQAFETALEELEKKEKQEEIKLKNLRITLDQHRTKEVETKSRLSQIETEINLQTEEIEEKLGILKEDISSLEVDPSISLGKTEKEIRKLRRDLESQPNINLKAISECEKQQSRFEFLQSQIKDLNESQGKLLEIITKLDETSRQMFEETFEKIRARFKENFLLLFNGGEADLKLTANQDILDAGIDIIAQPPGKKMRSIQLMSGGEKCLCAIALLFALFETQSIPFCILDEIDAPLDDTNIERFTNVLKQFVKNNQFIIITHNKRTMAIAENLLGVSMQEKGVTKIIPLEFNSKKTPQTAIA